MMENSKGVDCVVRMFGKTGLVYVRETREHGSNVRIGSTDVLSGKFKRLHREIWGEVERIRCARLCICLGVL